jgi:hypothetical protein
MDPDNLCSNLSKADASPNGASSTGDSAIPQESAGNSSGSGAEQEPGPYLVERRTGLRGQGIAPGRVPAHMIRKNTEDALHEKNPEIPYVKTERALRDLVCSLMERQDRMNEEILLRVIDLQYRLDDLEDRTTSSRRKKASGAEVSG